MRWQTQKMQDRKEWHDFFAWHPVIIAVPGETISWAWLETVERKVVDGCDGIAEHIWEYRPRERKLQ